MLSPTEIRVGSYVVIHDVRAGSVYAPKTMPSFDGKPYEIAAISLPFVLLADGFRRFAVDIRAFELMQVGNDYVRAYHHPAIDMTPSRFNSAPALVAIRA